MTTAHTRTKIHTAAVGAVIATVVAPALLVLGAGTRAGGHPQSSNTARLWFMRRT